MIQNRIHILRPAGIIAALVGIGPAAQAVSLGDVEIHGFVSQGWIQNWGNNFPFEADDGTFDLREMAVNASYATGSLRIGAQVFAQRLGNYGEDKPFLDWAVVDYNVHRSFGVRVGRVKFPRGLYGEALDVDAIRPFVFLPMSIYNPVVRDFASSFDGGMFYGNVDFGGAGSVDYKVFYGDIPMDTDQGAADYFNDTGIFGGAGVGELGLDAVWGGMLTWNTPLDGIRVAYSFNRLVDLVGTGPLAVMPSVSTSLMTDGYATHTLSAEWLLDAWTFAAEWQDVGGDFVVTTPFGNRETTAALRNWYVSAARRLGERLELGVYYSSERNTSPAPDTPDIATYNRAWVASARYDITANWLVKVEVRRGKGLQSVFDTARTPNPEPSEHSTSLAIKTTYSF